MSKLSKPSKVHKPEKGSVSKPDKPNPIAAWFDHHYAKLCLGVLVLAIGLRVSLLIELPRMPFNELHRHGELDMNFFDQWGDRIADGDFLTDTIWHPYHEWHGVIAQSTGLQTVEEGKAKWAEWYGGKQYHQEPIYPLVIGLCKIIAPPGRYLVYVLQMIAGVLSVWMIMWLGRHYFGAMTGILGGLLFTLYGPNLLFDVTLLRTSFNTTLALSMILVAEQLMRGKSKPWLMGLLGGLGYLMWTTIMLLWIPLVVRWLFTRRQDIKASWQVVLGFGLLLSFLVIRNSITGSPLLSTSSVGPITYILSNFPTYEPERGFAYFPQAGLVMNKSNGQFVPAILEIIDIHPSFWSWVGLQFKKLGATFHWYEIPNNINTYLASETSLTLKITCIPFSLIAAFGLTGFILGFRKRKLYTLLIALLSQIAVMVIFYVLCRFRVSMVAMLAIPAGYTLQMISGFGEWRKVALAVVVSLAFFLCIVRPAPKIQVTFKKGDVGSYFTYYYLSRLEKYMQAGDSRAAAELIGDLIKTMPKEFEQVASYTELSPWPARQELADYYGALYLDQGNLYREAGDMTKANLCFQMSKRLKKQ